LVDAEGKKIKKVFNFLKLQDNLSNTLLANVDLMQEDFLIVV